MATTQETRQLVTQPVMQGADKYASDAKKVSGSLDGMKLSAEQAAKASEKVGVSTEKQRRELVSTASAVDRVMNRVSAASRIEAQFSRDIELVNRALNTGAIGAQRHAQAVGAIEQAHRRAMDAVKRNEESMTRGTASASRMSDMFGRLQGVLASVGAALGVRQLIEYADTWTRLEGRLRLVTGSTAELAGVQQRLFDSAQRTRSSFEGTVDLYTRVARNAEQLGLSQQRLLDMTETVNKAIRVGGSTAQEASAGVVQFGQAIASGVLRGDEFRSIMENLPGLAEALRQGLGKTTGELRKMAEAGELTATKVIGAIEKMRDKVSGDFAKLPATVGDAFIVLGNSILKYIGEADRATGFTAALSSAIIGLAGSLEDVVKIGGAALVGLFAAKLPAAITATAAAINTLTAALARNPLGLIVVLATQAIAAVVLFRDQIRPLSDSMATLGDYARAAFETIRVYGSAAWSAVSEGLSNLGDFVRRTFGESIVNSVGVVGRAADFFRAAFSAIGQSVKTWANLTINAVRLVADVFGELGQEIWNTLKAAFERIVELAGAFAADFWDTITSFELQNSRITAQIERGFGQAVESALKNVGARARSIFQTDVVGDATAGMVETVIGIGGAWRNAAEGIQENEREIARLTGRLTMMGQGVPRVAAGLNGIGAAAGKAAKEVEKLAEKLDASTGGFGNRDVGGAASSLLKHIELTRQYEAVAKKSAETQAVLARAQAGFNQGLAALNRTLEESRQKLADQNGELEFQNRILRLEVEGTGDAEAAIAALTKQRAIENIEKRRDIELSEKLVAIRELESRADGGGFGVLSGDMNAQALAALRNDFDLTRESYESIINATATNEDLKQLKRLQDEASGPVTEIFKNAAKNIQSAMADTFREILDGGINSFKDLGSSLLNIMKEVAAQIAALMVFRPVMGGLLGAFGASPDFIRQMGGTVFGGGESGGGILSGIGSAISGAGSWIGGLFGGGGAAAASQAAVLADFGIAGAATATGASAMGGAGGLLAGLGGAVPYIGTGLAAAALIAPMLFKKKPSVGPGQAATLQQGALELEILRAAADNGGSVSTAAQYGKGAITGFADLFDAVGGGRFTTGTGFNIGNNQKEGFSYALYSPGQTPGSYDNTAEAKNLASAEEAVTQAFLAAMEAGLVEGLSDTFKTAFDSVKPTTTEELQDIVARVNAYEAAIKPALDMLDPANSGLGQALKASADAFDALKESATELGLALDPLDEKAAEAAQAIRDGFVQGLEQQARAATGRGYIDQLLGFQSAAQADELSNLQFINDPAAMAYNQGLINTRFGGQVGSALEGMSVEQLQDVVATFGSATNSTGVYITALANQLIELGGAAEEAATGITDAGQKLLDQLAVRELRLAGQDREAIIAEGATQKAEQLAAALAEGFNSEQLSRLAAVIDGELNKALADFDAALVQAAEAAAEAARQVEAEALAQARASRDFDTDLSIRESRLGGNNRGALELELAAQKIAAIEAAEAAGRTADQIARLAAVLDGEAAKALADFDAQLGNIPGAIDAATDALRRFNEDLQVRGAALAGDDLATALLQFDISAQRQREEAALIAGADLAELERVLAGERLKIIEDYNARLAEEQERAAEAALRAQEQAAEEQRRLQEEAARAAEEAARKIADAMRAAADLNDSLEVRLLRAQGLDAQADRLELVKRQQRELSDALDLKAAGGNPDINLLKIVQALELSNLGKQSAGVSRGSFYDPAAYDQFFTQGASASLVAANQNMRGMDLLTARRIDAGTSNVITVDGDGNPIRGPGAGGATSFDDIRPWTSLTIGEWKREQDRLVTPLQEISTNTAVLTEIRDLLAERPEQSSGDGWQELVSILRRQLNETRNQNRERRRERTTYRADGPVGSGFQIRRARSA